MPSVAPRRTATASNPRGRQLLHLARRRAWWSFGLLQAMFGHHENKYEKLAHDVTAALQNNDLDEVKKYQNAETATMINARDRRPRRRPARAAGQTQERSKKPRPAVRPIESTSSTVAFDKGVVHEKIKVDPELQDRALLSTTGFRRKYGGACSMHGTYAVTLCRRRVRRRAARAGSRIARRS